MNSPEETLGRLPAPLPHRTKPKAATLASDLLPLGDFLCFLFAAALSTYFYTHGLALFSFAPEYGQGHEQAVVIAAVLASFFLYDPRFGVLAGCGQKALLIRSYVLRFMLLTGVLLALGQITHVLENFPGGWLLMAFTTSLVLTSLIRLLATRYVRRLQQKGALTEVIAVVGAGPVADRVVQALRQTRPAAIELLGVFDDKSVNATHDGIKPTGTLAQLMELGKTRKIDWILLTLPPTAEQRVISMVERLKTLAVPIGLCPQYMEFAVPNRAIDYVGGSVPVSLLADRPIQRWDAVVKAAEDYVLGAMITVLLLPVLALIAIAIRIDSPGPVIFKQRRHAFNNHEFDIYKFRSMRWNPKPETGALQQTSRDDPRFTRLGRFLRRTSLDELPQLFNVLQGDMSLVGPRPHAVNMRTENRLGNEITEQYAHRHRVKPRHDGVVAGEWFARRHRYHGAIAAARGTGSVLHRKLVVVAGFQNSGTDLPRSPQKDQRLLGHFYKSRFHPNCGVAEKISCLHINICARRNFFRALHLGEL